MLGPLVCCGRVLEVLPWSSLTKRRLGQANFQPFQRLLLL